MFLVEDDEAVTSIHMSFLFDRYGKKILRDEKEKVMTRRAEESAQHGGFKDEAKHAAEQRKKDEEALENLLAEFDPRGQKLISFDMFKVGIKKVSCRSPKTNFRIPNLDVLPSLSLSPDVTISHVMLWLVGWCAPLTDR